MDLKDHWNRFYSVKQAEELGWYEEYPGETLCMVEKCDLYPEAIILNVGAGATTLIEYLLLMGFSNIIASDLSKHSLDQLKVRLGEDNEKIRWIVDDLSDPKELNLIEPVDLWLDRAVLHFLTKREEQDSYFRLLKRSIKPDGYALFAEFNLDGATKCAGLPTFRYSVEMLSDKLGQEFSLLDHFNHTFISPSGSPRPYIYALFRRISKIK